MEFENRLHTARSSHKQRKVSHGFLNRKTILEGFSKLDTFGRPVSLTFKGRESYQTVWGACVSLCIYILVGLLAIAFWVDYGDQGIQKRLVIQELVNPELSTGAVDIGWKG